MKIKIVINGKSVEIEIPDGWSGTVFSFEKKPDQLLEIISKIIQELKS